MSHAPVDAPAPAAPSGLAEDLALSPEALERLRDIGLRLDRSGRFWHHDEEVRHERLAAALRRWLDVVDGRDVIRLDARRYAYVTVEDAHLRAVRARWQGDRCLVTWDDGAEAELPYHALSQAADHALYVPAGAPRQLVGRIAGAAYHTITERIEEDAHGSFALVAAGQRWPISLRPTR